MSAATHGTLRFEDGAWQFRTSSIVARRLRRLFTSAKATGDVIRIPHTADTAEDVEWILTRYPHAMPADHASILRKYNRGNRDAHQQASEIQQLENIPQPAGIGTPLRNYQCQGVLLAQLKRGILIGDDMGLGKTATAIGIMAAEDARPALVVCATHVQQQWVDQVRKFAPGLRCHIIRKRKEYLLPKHDIAICTYSKLDAWAGKYPWKAVIYDEVQELRRGLDTAKGRAAGILATSTDYRIGLSATPVYNYANETFHVFDFLSPGALGTYDEFLSEWGDGMDGKVLNAEALGAWLREQKIYLRRTCRDVGRELPPLHKISHTIDFKQDALERLKGPAVALARSVLEGKFTERGQAARQLDIMLRQATGIGKAPFVADFVSDLVDSGKKVVLAGWHREVYTVWQEELKNRRIGNVLYTGSESPTQKIAATKEFIDGDAKVFIMSLRSGAGLDGLQHVCNTVVFGELDWSPKVHDQLIGRARRDEQKEPVTAFYLIADDGSDPVIANVLGIKDRQSTAITDPELLKNMEDDSLSPAEIEETRGTILARKWLARN